MNDDIFRPITLQDLQQINDCLQHTDTRTCDYTIGGIYMWIDYFDYRYCIIDDTLFIKGVDENNRLTPAFSLPIGKMSMDSALVFLKEYCATNNINIRFSAIPHDKISLFPSEQKWHIEQLNIWGDYLYDASSLATLSGNKLKKKRNHVNRFIADNPHYIFETITPSNINKVKDFYDNLTILTPDNSQLSKFERTQVFNILNEYHQYPFKGALLRTDKGKIAAFTIGEIISDTLYIHIEKMNHLITGAGETINKLFAKKILESHAIKYINREEDVGDIGLRIAKMSYNPVMILDKYNVSMV